MPQIFVFTPENSSIKTFNAGEADGFEGPVLTIHWRTPGVQVVSLQCTEDQRIPVNTHAAWARLHALWRPWQTARKLHVKQMFRVESQAAATAAAAAAAIAGTTGRTTIRTPSRPVPVASPASPVGESGGWDDEGAEDWRHAVASTLPQGSLLTPKSLEAAGSPSAAALPAASTAPTSMSNGDVSNPPTPSPTAPSSPTHAASANLLRSRYDRPLVDRDHVAVTQANMLAAAAVAAAHATAFTQGSAASAAADARNADLSQREWGPGAGGSVVSGRAPTKADSFNPPSRHGTPSSSGNGGRHSVERGDRAFRNFSPTDVAPPLGSETRNAAAANAAGSFWTRGSGDRQSPPSTWTRDSRSRGSAADGSRVGGSEWAAPTTPPSGMGGPLGAGRSAEASSFDESDSRARAWRSISPTQARAVSRGDDSGTSPSSPVLPVNTPPGWTVAKQDQLAALLAEARTVGIGPPSTPAPHPIPLSMLPPSAAKPGGANNILSTAHELLRQLGGSMGGMGGALDGATPNQTAALLMAAAMAAAANSGAGSPPRPPPPSIIGGGAPFFDLAPPLVGSAALFPLETAKKGDLFASLDGAFLGSGHLSDGVSGLGLSSGAHEDLLRHS